MIKIFRETMAAGKIAFIMFLFCTLHAPARMHKTKLKLQ